LAEVNLKPDPLNSKRNKAIFDIALNGFLKMAVTEFPILGMPLIGPIYRMMVNYALGYMFDYIQNIVTLNVISSQVESQIKAYQEASERLEIAYKVGDKDAISKTKEDYKKTLNKLLDWNA
jgi:hypothetical protein